MVLTVSALQATCSVPGCHSCGAQNAHKAHQVMQPHTTHAQQHHATRTRKLPDTTTISMSSCSSPLSIANSSSVLKATPGVVMSPPSSPRTSIDSRQTSEPGCEEIGDAYTTQVRRSSTDASKDPCRRGHSKYKATGEGMSQVWHAFVEHKKSKTALEGWESGMHLHCSIRSKPNAVRWQCRWKRVPGEAAHHGSNIS